MIFNNTGKFAFRIQATIILLSLRNRSTLIGSCRSRLSSVYKKSKNIGVFLGNRHITLGSLLTEATSTKEAIFFSPETIQNLGLVGIGISLVGLFSLASILIIYPDAANGLHNMLGFRNNTDNFQTQLEDLNNTLTVLQADVERLLVISEGNRAIRENIAHQLDEKFQVIHRALMFLDTRSENSHKILIALLDDLNTIGRRLGEDSREMEFLNNVEILIREVDTFEESSTAFVTHAFQIENTAINFKMWTNPIDSNSVYSNLFSLEQIIEVLQIPQKGICSVIPNMCNSFIDSVGTFLPICPYPLLWIIVQSLPYMLEISRHKDVLRYFYIKWAPSFIYKLYL
jgi:hypothetical protein